MASCENTSNERDNTQQDEVYFHSTQMQSAHEQLLLKQEEENRSKSIISRLSSFKNDLPCLEPTRPKAKPVKAKETSRKQQVSKVKSKNKSMSSKVRESYESDKFSYFAGGQTKISDFIKGINKIEDIDRIKPTDDLKLYTPDEWQVLIRHIKLKFPNLSTTNKKSLKEINKKLIENQTASQKSTDNEGASLWNHASSQPELGLSNDELKWLYDLDDEQMNYNGSSFIEDHEPNDASLIVTISQSDNHQTDNKYPTQNDYEIISDSESDTQEFKLSKVQVLQTIYDETNNEPHQKEPNFDPLTSFQSFPIKVKNWQKQELINSQLEEVKSDKESIFGTGSQHKPIDLSFEENNAIDSSLIETPKRKRKHKFASPLNVIQEAEKSVTNLEEIKDNVEEIIMSSDDESIYSTAKEKFDSKQNSPVKSQPSLLKLLDNSSSDSNDDNDDYPTSSMPVPKNLNRKIMRTSILEIPQAIKIKDYENKEHGVKLRKLDSNIKQIVDLDQVPDSEFSDEENISLVEITREIEDSKKNHKELSILQVPSSPEIIQNHDLSNISNLQFHEVKDLFKQLGLKSVRSRAKMVEIIENLSNLTKSVNIATLNTQEFQTEVSKSINNLIRNDDNFYQKILSYEPIKLDHLQGWLKGQHYNIELDVLRVYCDKNLIITTNQ